MTEPSSRRQSFGLLGIAAAGCVACCAGPLLAFLGGVTIAGVASTLLIGGLGLVVAIVAATAFLAVRHRGRRAAGAEPVMIAAPTRKPPSRDRTAG